MTIKDPVTNTEFDTALTHDELNKIMAKRAKIHDEYLKRFIEAENISEELHKKQDEAKKLQKKLDEFDDDNLAPVRATVAHYREIYDRREQPTTHYIIMCQKSKAKKFEYDTKNKELIEWAQANKKELLKSPEIAKSQANKLFKEMEAKKLPPNVKLKSNEVTFRYVRLLGKES